MMKIFLIIINLLLWGICFLDWFSGGDKSGLLAYFLKYPAILSTLILIFYLLIKGYK